MPAYNAEKYITEAILSAIDQYYSNWELIIINDGSTDKTQDVILSFNDSRIRYFRQPNKGVSAARNVGLTNMQGDYFCFLDADDLLTTNSLESRLKIFSSSKKISFVGGAQEQRNSDLSKVMTIQYPTYTGSPRKGLISLDPGCFINCGTWLIKRNKQLKYSFQEKMKHSEDLTFFLSISNDGFLDYTSEIVQIYRRHHSAMSNLDGLLKGYRQFYSFALRNGYFKTESEKVYLNRKIFSIMLKSYLSSYNIKGVFNVLKNSIFEK